MTQALDVAEQLLLACLANPDGDHAARLASFPASESEHLLALARQSRCLALLCRVIVRCGASFPSVAQLADEAREQALVSLAQARGLVRAVRLMRDAGMDPIALKGVALAWRDYPAPQLRVLRDVDLLLPSEEVERAQQLLLSQAGYAAAPWAGQYGTEYGHQLPEIVDQEHGLVIELHHRINARGWVGDEPMMQLLRTEAEEIELLGEVIRVPSARANLLHLVEHATLHHAFANGPAILADLHYLCRNNAIDWPALLVEAGELRLVPSLELLGAIGKKFGAVWVPECLAAAVPEAVLAGAQQAMFAGEEIHQQYALLWRLADHSGGATGPAQAFARIFRPNRHQLARLSGRDPTSPWRWLGYPRWLVEKGGRFAMAKHSEADSVNYGNYAKLRGWVEDGAVGREVSAG